MESFIDIHLKWYVGLIIMPVLINYLTIYWTLPEIFEDGK